MQAENEALKQAARENTRYYASLLKEAGANLGTLKKELEETQSQLATVQAELVAVAADRDDARSQLAIRLAERERLLILIYYEVALNGT